MSSKTPIFKMGSYTFFTTCLLHSTLALSCGTLMMLLHTNEMSAFGHVSKFKGSTPHDQLLIQTSLSFSGLLLFAIGLLLMMAAFVNDRDFQRFFAKGCVVLHLMMAVWRVYFGRRIENLGWDLAKQVAGDLALALSSFVFMETKSMTDPEKNNVYIALLTHLLKGVENSDEPCNIAVVPWEDLI